MKCFHYVAALLKGMDYTAASTAVFRFQVLLKRLGVLAHVMKQARKIAGAPQPDRLQTLRRTLRCLPQVCKDGLPCALPVREFANMRIILYMSRRISFDLPFPTVAYGKTDFPAFLIILFCFYFIISCYLSIAIADWQKVHYFVIKVSHNCSNCCCKNTIYYQKLSLIFLSRTVKLPPRKSNSYI